MVKGFEKIVFVLLVSIVGLGLSFTFAQGTSLTNTKANSQINGALDDFFGSGGTTEVTPEQVAAVDNKQFDYIYDASVTAQVHQQILQGLELNTAATQEIATVLQQFTPELQQQIMDEAFVEGGWRATNMVDVLAATILTAYGILQGLDETTPVQDAAIRDLFRVAFDGPEMRTMQNTDKQLITESLFIIAVLSALQNEEAKVAGDAASLADVKQGAKDLLLSFGLHPSILKLGETGLEQSDKLVAVTAQIEAGTTTFEAAFPEVIADYQKLGSTVTPVVPVTQDSATPTDSPTTPSSSGGINAALGIGGSSADNSGGTGLTNLPTTPEETVPTMPTTPLVGGTVPETSAVNPLAPQPPTPNPLAQNPLAGNPVNPLAQLKKPDLFSGSFSDGELTLTLEGDGESYKGELAFGTQAFPVTAVASETDLQGEFINGGDSFSFTAKLQETVLSFDSEGNSFSLEKQQLQNPLGN